MDFNHVLAEVGNYMTSNEQSALLIIKYLSLSNRASTEVLALRERLYRSNEQAMYGRIQAPQLPYDVETIRIKESANN